MKKIAILGSTGSIGKNTLSVLESISGYEVHALSTNENIGLLREQVRKYRPRAVAIADEKSAKEFFTDPLRGTDVFWGKDGLLNLCEGADLVVLGIVGIAGLPVLEYCLKRKIPIAIATKEALVCGGQVVRSLMDETKTPVLPLDSEISAIFQCIGTEDKSRIEKILLTASGGPFRDSPPEKIRNATLAEALSHPNWSMGAKISIDSATMANKGLEIMETRWMFDVDPEKIAVVVHKESIVHSMVEFVDGAVMAQLGATDMRLPIAYALSYPHRAPNNARKLDLFQTGTLSFEKPDLDRFPCLALAMEAVKGGAAMQLVYNAANDAAVSLFRAGEIRFFEIAEFIKRLLNEFSGLTVTSFEEIYEANDRITARALRLNNL